MTYRVGSLFTGYDGLGMGLSAVLETRTVWFSEIEPAAITVLQHHLPSVPNLGDIATIDWANVEPVDILAGGFPCQDISNAGKRAGLRPDTRSGLWSHMAYAVSQLRPKLVVIENVRGLLSADAHCDLEPCPWCLGDNEGRPLRALGAICGDLASVGYDTQWCGLRAADVGAPHGRFRVFITAWNTAENPHRAACSQWWPPEPEQTESGGSWADVGGRSSQLVADPCGGGRRATVSELLPRESDADRCTPTDADDRGRDWRTQTPQRFQVGRAAAERCGAAVPDTDRAAVREQPECVSRRGSTAIAGRPGAATTDAEITERRGTQPEHLETTTERTTEPGERASAIAWGDYTPAIHRWELTLGRPAPTPTITGKRGGQQLSPLFVEWLMGLPEGHVTAVPGLNRNDQLKLLGNGVVPLQCAAALSFLLADRCEVAA